MESSASNEELRS
jgi:hypothetical protein